MAFLRSTALRMSILYLVDPWKQRLGVWYIAEDHPDLPAVVTSPSGTTLTYGELVGRAHQIVHALRARGLGDDDVVAYVLPNDVDVLWWQLAACRSPGCGRSPSTRSCPRRNTRAILEHSGAAAVVVHADFADSVEPSRRGAACGSRWAGRIDGFELDDGPDRRTPHHAPAGPDVRYADLLLVGDHRLCRRPSPAPRFSATHRSSPTG